MYLNLKYFFSVGQGVGGARVSEFFTKYTHLIFFFFLGGGGWRGARGEGGLQLVNCFTKDPNLNNTFFFVC